jgi:hypothetical protein
MQHANYKPIIGDCLSGNSVRDVRKFTDYVSGKSLQKEKAKGEVKDSQ